MTRRSTASTTTSQGTAARLATAVAGAWADVRYANRRFAEKNMGPLRHR